MRQQYAWRSKALGAVLALVAFIILEHIIRIQTSKEAAIFRSQAEINASELRTFYPERGEIYDRSGHLLAGNRIVYEIGVDLASVKDPEAIAAAVSTRT
jgi:cell division protein FtsI/penicillin-binding protein 2